MRRHGLAIGPLPTGRGVLGELIRRPGAVADRRCRRASALLRLSRRPPADARVPRRADPGRRRALRQPVPDREGRRLARSPRRTSRRRCCWPSSRASRSTTRGAYTGAERAPDELQRTVDALDATMQIARALGGQTDLDAILELVAKRGRALVSARALVIELAAATELEVAAGAGRAARRSGRAAGRRSRTRSPAQAIAHRRLAAPRATSSTARASSEHGLGVLGLHARAALVVPLVFREQSYGVLVAIDRLDGGPEFTRRGPAAARGVRGQRGDRRRDRRSRRRTSGAASDSRPPRPSARWARELHDETLQSLGSLRSVLVGGAPRRERRTRSARRSRERYRAARVRHRDPACADHRAAARRAGPARR